MTQYAREENEKLVFPTDAEFSGVSNWRTNDTALRRRHYLPLHGEPEEREGYEAEPSEWHVVEKTETRYEPRNEDPITHEPFLEDVMEPDPETGKMVKTGVRQVTRLVPVTFDASYIQIDEWVYLPVPVPPAPDPEPVIYSKMKIGLAMFDAGIWNAFWDMLTDRQKMMWNDAVNFNSQYPEFAAGLAAFKQAFPQIDADSMLEQCVAE